MSLMSRVKGQMHGAHIAMAGLLQMAPPPAAKAIERTNSAQESFRFTWEKAIKASSANVQPMKNDGSAPEKAIKAAPANVRPMNLRQVNVQQMNVQAKKNDGSAPEKREVIVEQDEKPEDAIEAAPANVPPMKNAGSAPEKPEVRAGEDEKPEDATDLVKAAQPEAGEPHETHPPVAEQATKVLVETQPQKKLAGASDKQAAVETKKHKVKNEGEVELVDEAKAPAEASVTTSLPVAPAPVAVPAVVQGPSIFADVVSDGKGVAKTDALPAKRDRANVASADNAGKAADSKPAAEIENAKALPVVEMKAKPFDASILPVAANHAGAPVANTPEVNATSAPGVWQGASAATTAPVAHKSTGLQATAELQNNAPVTTTGADVNAAHVSATGPGQLEVGVLDGTHGWLKIRAELGTDGSVNALLTSNATAHEALKEAVPALSGYLASESVNVGRIAVHQAPESSAAGGDMTNADGGSGGSGGGAASFHQGDDRDGGSAANRFWNGSARATTQQEMDSATNGISAAVFGGASAGFSGNGIGSWLSVTV